MKKKIIKRTVAGLFLSSVIGIAGLVTLMLHPQLVFAHKFEYKNFRVFANEVIDEDISIILEKADSLTRQGELYDEDYTFDIFLCYNTNFNNLDSWLLGSWSAARAVDNNVIVKTPVNISRNSATNGDTRFDFDYLLAHEMIHCLQEHKYGKKKFNPFSPPPLWKLEGYPEYIGHLDEIQSPKYNLKDAISLFLEKTQAQPDELSIINLADSVNTPYIYFKGRLMTEYLIDEKGQTYDEILNSEQSEEQVWQEVLNWYDSGTN